MIILYKNFIYFFQLLDSKRKLYFFVMVAALCFQSMLEALGIGLVIPIIGSLFGSEYFSNYLNKFPYPFLINDYDHFFLTKLILLIILLFFIIKAIILILIVNYTNKFIFNVQSFLKKKFFSDFLKTDYKDLSLFSSNRLINNLTVNFSILTNNFLLPLVYCLADGLIIFAIALLITFFYPKSFLVILFICGLLILFFFKLFNKYLKKKGLDKSKNEETQIKVVNEAAGSIKICKIYEIENFLIKDFVNSNSKISAIQANIATINNIPRIMLEIFGLTLIIILIFFFISTGTSTKIIIASLAVFSAAAFKIMPAMNRILFSLQGLSYSSFIFDEIRFFQNIYVQQFEKKTLTNFKNSIFIDSNISLKNITFGYPNNKNIINNLNFELQLGKSVGIYGASGSGKTTFLDLLVGLYKPVSGKVFIDSRELNYDKSFWYKNFTYATQNVFIFEGSLLSNITLNQSGFVDYDFVNQILDVLQLKDFVESHKDKLNMVIGEKGIGLSGGQSQRIGIARAIYKKSKIIIMDEPTSALDVKTEDFIFKNFSKVSTSTCVIVSHRKSAFQNCSSVYQFTLNGNLEKI
jgi:ABC-type multidrug transport system fused ATPase/permease subunit